MKQLAEDRLFLPELWLDKFIPAHLNFSDYGQAEEKNLYSKSTKKVINKYFINIK